MLSSRLALGLIGVLVLGVFLCLPAQASIVIPANHSSDPVSAGSSLDDVRLEVDLSVDGGIATMTFSNASVSPENSAVFKMITVDLIDSDTDQAILWDPVIRDDLSDGSYTWGSYNTLPGFNPMITDGESMIELNAANPAPQNGLLPGESLVVEFSTYLADGAGIADYLSAFGGGDDTSNYSLGFHAISTDTIENDGSLSGARVPEPATLGLLATGAIALIRRRCLG